MTLPPQRLKPRFYVKAFCGTREGMPDTNHCTIGSSRRLGCEAS
jgi:hypothetical protein